jgi:gas vesicle protein
MRRFFSFLVGTLTGALVGAAAALLLAPMSGEELQDRARERVSTLTDDIRDAYAARVAQLEAELEDLRKPQKAKKKEEKES